MGNKIMYVAIAIAIGAGLVSSILNWKQDSVNPDVVACTEEAMLCPDGSYVGRTGPRCEFTCPSVTPKINEADAGDGVILTTPKLNSLVTTPLTITGVVPGSWYFEGSFGVVLLDGNGIQVGVVPAVAQSDWMTASPVPFVATLTFTNPYQTGDPEKMKIGTLQLRNDNPSGLPQNDKKFEIPVRFAP